MAFQAQCFQRGRWYSSPARWRPPQSGRGRSSGGGSRSRLLWEVVTPTGPSGPPWESPGRHPGVGRTPMAGGAGTPVVAGRAVRRPLCRQPPWETGKSPTSWDAGHGKRLDPALLQPCFHCGNMAEIALLRLQVGLPTSGAWHPRQVSGPGKPSCVRSSSPPGRWQKLQPKLMGGVVEFQVRGPGVRGFPGDGGGSRSVVTGRAEGDLRIGARRRVGRDSSMANAAVREEEGMPIVGKRSLGAQSHRAEEGHGQDSQPEETGRGGSLVPPSGQTRVLPDGNLQGQVHAGLIEIEQARSVLLGCACRAWRWPARLQGRWASLPRSRRRSPGPIRPGTRRRSRRRSLDAEVGVPSDRTVGERDPLRSCWIRIPRLAGIRLPG